MPLVIELIVLMLAAYAAGVGIGWMVWGNALAPPGGQEPGSQTEPQTEPGPDNGDSP